MSYLARAAKIASDFAKKNLGRLDPPPSSRPAGEAAFNKTIMKMLTAPESNLQEMEVIDVPTFFGGHVENPFDIDHKRRNPPDSLDPDPKSTAASTVRPRSHVNDLRRYAEQFAKQFGNDQDTLGRVDEKTKPDFRSDLERLLDKVLPSPADYNPNRRHTGSYPRVPDPSDTDLRKNPRRPSRGGGYPLPRDPRGTPLPKTPGTDETRMPEGCQAIEEQLRKEFGLEVTICGGGSISETITSGPDRTKTHQKNPRKSRRGRK